MSNFESSESQVPNTATVEAMQEARVGELPSFESVAELLSDLNAEY